MPAMPEELADLVEQSAADGTPIREVARQDRVEFTEAFLANHPPGQWISPGRERPTNTSIAPRATRRDQTENGYLNDRQ
ncbi:hypothetical protein [Streptosporangium minutum]|uniref:hypothetical protein n=1 Tax=Streptosporangium minutum TaxID=569862 RepID=UPI001F607D47|nr:hypothetical protein [Streptosporangium minutum]